MTMNGGNAGSDEQLATEDIYRIAYTEFGLGAAENSRHGTTRTEVIAIDLVGKFSQT